MFVTTSRAALRAWLYINILLGAVWAKAFNLQWADIGWLALVYLVLWVILDILDRRSDQR